MSALRVLDSTPPLVRQHVASGPPETLLEYAAWLSGQIDAERRWLDDDDPSKLRADVQAEHRARYEFARECRDKLGLMLSIEREAQIRAQHEDRVDASYKAAGFGGTEHTALADRFADGDR